jgi:hypothetical protein
MVRGRFAERSAPGTAAATAVVGAVEVVVVGVGVGDAPTAGGAAAPTMLNTARTTTVLLPQARTRPVRLIGRLSSG